MTLTIIDVNDIGSGVRFTFAADGDDLHVIEGVTLASRDNDAIAWGARDGTSTVIDGTVTSLGGPNVEGDNNTINIGETGKFRSFEENPGNSGLFLFGGENVLTNQGSFVAANGLGILSGANLFGGGNNQIQNSGTIEAASPIFLGFAGTTGDRLVNSGLVAASAFADDTQDEQFNNAVFAQGGNTRVLNLEEGQLVATSSEGAGIRFDDVATGSVAKNLGSIESLLWYGVDFSNVTTGDPLLINLGTISGGEGAFIGHFGVDKVANRGTMEGNVEMGGGADVFDNRAGTLFGNWSGGDGADFYNGRLDATVTGVIDGGANADVIHGGDNRDEIVAGSGDDEVRGFGGNDLIQLVSGSNLALGGDGDDQVNGGSDGDNVFGDRGDDNLFGRNGNDTLRGGADNDLLEGGAGVDLMFGGTGLDEFVFRSEAEIGLTSGARDRIFDFTPGEDILRFSSIDADATTGGNQVFDFIGAAAFSGTAGELRYSSANGLVQGDTDGDGAADFALQLTTRPDLTEADIIL